MKFVIEGKPIPWMRAGRHGWKYFDRQHAKKEEVRNIVKNQMKDQEPFSTPLKLTIEFHMVIPHSWSKIKQRNALKKPHAGIPDLDNLTKFIYDALNGVLWKDDAIIFELAARKFYSTEGKTVFIVEPYGGKRLETLPGLE